MKRRISGRVWGWIPVLVCGFLAPAPAMEYKPIPLCNETAKVDSLQEWVWIDDAMNPDLAPYKGYQRFEYFSGTCMQSRMIQKPYYMTDKYLTATYTLRPDGRTADFVFKSSNPQNDSATGTMFYSEAGELDSSLFVQPTTRNGRKVFESELDRTLHRPGYDLIQVFSRIGDSAWQARQSDSIVSGDSGKTIYTDDGPDHVITRCVDKGQTYVCNPEGTGYLEKQVWFLTQGRADSLSTYDMLGRLVSTDKYFWSSKAAGAVMPGHAASRHAGALPGDFFNLLGRLLPREQAQGNSWVTPPPLR